MKINYVIASWSGKNTGRAKYKLDKPSPEDHLKDHFEQLKSIQNNLTQVTLMKPKCDDPYDDYYNFDNNLDIPLVEITCDNYGYSNGQWLKCFEIYKESFDYYIFIEDDYCPFMDNFDRKLVELYKEYFPNNIGKLSGVVLNYNNLPKHWSSIIIISSQTLSLLYDKWNGDARKYLVTELSKYDRATEKFKRTGGYYQINFSLLFTLKNIDIKGIKGYNWPYFNAKQRLLYNLIEGKDPSKCKKKYVINKHNIKYDFITGPIQLLKKYNQNTPYL